MEKLNKSELDQFTYIYEKYNALQNLLMIEDVDNDLRKRIQQDFNAIEKEVVKFMNILEEKYTFNRYTSLIDPNDGTIM